ncbi:hypothetical protein V8D89_014337 [Ganoderma adspersum]
MGLRTVGPAREECGKQWTIVGLLVMERFIVRKKVSRGGKAEIDAVVSQREGRGEAEARWWTMAEELQALVDEDAQIVSGVMRDIADQATLAGRHSVTNRHDSDTSSTALLEQIQVSHLQAPAPRTPPGARESSTPAVADNDKPRGSMAQTLTICGNIEPALRPLTPQAYGQACRNHRQKDLFIEKTRAYCTFHKPGENTPSPSKANMHEEGNLPQRLRCDNPGSPEEQRLRG